MSSRRRSFLKSVLSARLGCGCDKFKLSEIFHPKPDHKPKASTPDPPTPNLRPRSSSSSREIREGINHEDCSSTSSTLSLNVDTASSNRSESENDLTGLASVSPCPRFGESIAVEKDSCDPFLDFQESMLQMILGREIYWEEDLKELLNCFLELNSPCHHDAIVQAFTEVCSHFMSGSSLEN